MPFVWRWGSFTFSNFRRSQRTLQKNSNPSCKVGRKFRNSTGKNRSQTTQSKTFSDLQIVQREMQQRCFPYLEFITDWFWAFAIKIKLNLSLLDDENNLKRYIYYSGKWSRAQKQFVHFFSTVSPCFIWFYDYLTLQLNIYWSPAVYFLSLGENIYLLRNMTRTSFSSREWEDYWGDTRGLYDC